MTAHHTGPRTVLLVLGGLEAGSTVAAQRGFCNQPMTGQTRRISSTVSGVNGVVPVFRAPDIGTAGSVPVQHILDIARKHGVTTY